ncbi:ParA family protein [Leptolyngbya sp. FACHB-541]|uniref:ParA family protein n=1 Tax=Leptolyngbya sp. FACHB-541 TaxID=2692810 RepID=UPI001689895B|nr:ParA family protein [Leptolyngbya sp. FACHB-541]MBD1995274.1 ParA family protein [Leptolyngbya sp. FACHB-541]
MNNNEALILLALSLSGGQGKTTCTFGLGLKAAALEIPTLLIDADPQYNLTTYLGLELKASDPTLLEVLKSDDPAVLEDAIYPVPGRSPHLFLIPSDRALNTAKQVLSSHPNPAVVLKRRLKPVMKDFKLIVIDSPPQRDHISYAGIGAAHHVVIPCEAHSKGVGSFIESWLLLEECRESESFSGQFLGVIPFRAKLAGNHYTLETRAGINAIKSFLLENQVDLNTIISPILESEVFKRCTNYGELPSESQNKRLSPKQLRELEYPLDVVLHRLGLLPELPDGPVLPNWEETTPVAEVVK